MLTTITDWLSPERRQGLQLLATIIATILVTAGVIAEADVQHLLVIVAAAIQAFAGLLALLHLSVADAATWMLGVGRGAIYGLAAVVAPAAAALGWITEAQSVTALTYVSLGLTALAAVIAVLYAKPLATVEEVADVDAVARRAADAATAAQLDAGTALGQLNPTTEH